MKTSLLIRLLLSTIMLAFFSLEIFSQSKKEIGQFEQDHAAFAHKKFFNGKDWALCKFAVIYKLSSSYVARDSDKTYGAKAKTSSGAYAVLNGVTEAQLEQITQKIGQNFIDKMNSELGINVVTWNEFKDAKSAEDLKAEDLGEEGREIFDRTQGLAYVMSYDDSPIYHKVIVLVPGGKKLAKEIDKNVMQLTMFIDFAELLASAEVEVKLAGIKSSHTDYSGDLNRFVYEVTESSEQKILGGVRITPSFASGDASVGSVGNTAIYTTFMGHDLYGYSFTLKPANGEIISDIQYINSIEKNEGELPEIFQSRRNQKIENVTTFNVNADPAKFEEAVLDASNQYFDLIVKYYRMKSQ